MRLVQVQLKLNISNGHAKSTDTRQNCRPLNRLESQISGHRHIEIQIAFQEMTWQMNALYFCK